MHLGTSINRANIEGVILIGKKVQTLMYVQNF